MIADYHMHLVPHGRPIGAELLQPDHLRRYGESAAAQGLDEICMTEHDHRFADANGLHSHPYWPREGGLSLADYCAALSAARDDGVPVRTGIELDWLPGREDALAALIEPHAFDCVLGSVHFLGEATVDHPDYPIWDAWSVDEVWRRYFAEVRAAAASGLYDVMAHLDLAKVFAHVPGAALLAREYRDTAETLAAAGVATEINTNGLGKPIGEAYPAPALLAELQRCGVPLTFGSDAHESAHVGRDFDVAARLAHEAGYRSLAAFAARERREVPLG